MIHINESVKDRICKNDSSWNCENSRYIVRIIGIKKY